MNKKLLAIAVGAAIAMPGTVLAAGPTVYGKVNVSLENESTDPGPGAPNNDDSWVLDSNASRIGVKGDFDLDFGGLKAIYQAEYEINVDDGGSAPFSQRNIFGGLKGSFGTLKAGKFDTPLKVAQGDVDQFNDIDGDIKFIMAGEIRSSNIIQYSTPKLADMVTLNLAFIPAEDGTDFDGDGENENGLADSTSISVVLETGGLYAALARDTDIVDSLEVDTVTGSNVTLDITRAVAAYNFSGLELGALFQIAEETEGDGKDTSMLVSAAYGINNVKLKAQYGMTEADQTDEEATLMAIGADYKLGKNSKAFAYLSQVEFDQADTEDRTIGIGLEHKF